MKKEKTTFLANSNILFEKEEETYLFLRNFSSLEKSFEEKSSYFIELVEGNIKVIFAGNSPIKLEGKNNFPNNVFVSNTKIAEIIALSENAVCKIYKTR